MTDTTEVVIYWFRKDLRLNDLPSLKAACADGKRVIPVYIHDDVNAGDWAMGSASRWWLHHSLDSLSQSLADAGNALHIFEGDTLAVLPKIAQQVGASSIYCSRCHEPWAAALEVTVHQAGESSGFDVKRYPGSLLFEPENILNQAGLPFKVFTPFWKACLRSGEPAPSLPAPTSLPIIAANRKDIAGEITLEQLQLLPQQPNWAAGWDEHWQPGEAGARKKLDVFLKQAIKNYSEGRNHPATESTSRLSAHLHFGEISPRQVWHAAAQKRFESPELSDELNKFLSEMGWREFSHHLLHHFPHIPEKPFKPVFDNFPWLGSRAALKAWQQGQTGYPIVDAGMRELWQTGYMHNRVRMIVASFLTKHLLIPWRAGENWFWDTLVDADLANNASGWQWVAGSGADASPYFRIFNPTLQGQKFDKHGDYVRAWVPELAAVPDKYLHEPITAPQGILYNAGVELGVTYPLPIVDHKDARQAALSAYGTLKSA